MAKSTTTTRLVIVESPTKAKKISGFLGPGYIVEASFGHVRDLPRNAAEVPAKYKEQAWARLSGEREFAKWLTDGQVFDQRPASQVCAVVNDPADALFRLSVEPNAPGAGQREVVLWLSAWGGHEKRVGELRNSWASVLERLFPG